MRWALTESRRCSPSSIEPIRCRVDGGKPVASALDHRLIGRSPTTTTKGGPEGPPIVREPLAKRHAITGSPPLFSARGTGAVCAAATLCCWASVSSTAWANSFSNTSRVRGYFSPTSAAAKRTMLGR
jgi:hypothetical protein